MRHEQEKMARECQRAMAGQRAMAKKRLQLQKAKERIAGAVRSMSSCGTPVRPMLRVGESISVFGTKTLKPRDTGDLVGMDATAKVVCGQGLLYAAGGAAVNGSQEGLVASLEEVAFLSRRASQAVSGGQLDVACPSGDDVSSLVDTEDISLMNMTIQRQSEVFSAFYDRVANNVERTTESRDQIKTDEEKLSEIQASREQASAAFICFT